MRPQHAGGRGAAGGVRKGLRARPELPEPERARITPLGPNASGLVPALRAGAGSGGRCGSQRPNRVPSREAPGLPAPPPEAEAGRAPRARAPRTPPAPRAPAPRAHRGRTGPAARRPAACDRSARGPAHAPSPARPRFRVRRAARAPRVPARLPSRPRWRRPGSAEGAASLGEVGPPCAEEPPPAASPPPPSAAPRPRARWHRTMDASSPSGSCFSVGASSPGALVLLYSVGAPGSGAGSPPPATTPAGERGPTARRPSG